MPNNSAVKGDQVSFKLRTSIRTPVPCSILEMNCLTKNRLKLRVCTTSAATATSNVRDSGSASSAIFSFLLLMISSSDLVQCAGVSERLTQRHEVLPGPHACGRVQVVTKIDSHRPHWRAIMQTEADRIRIVAGELTKIDVAVYVPAVIENDAAQTGLY